MKLILEHASSKYGADMGRMNRLPTDCMAQIKLQMQKLSLVDGDYDQGGAYWGYTPGTAIYCAFTETVQVFCRSTNRQDAKTKVRNLLPNASFFR